MATVNNVITNVSGSVGIGTTNATSRLLVLGNSSLLSEPIATFKANGSQTGGVGVLDVQNSGGTSILFVTGSGYVGIGNTTPGQKLTVSGDFSAGTTTATASGYFSYQNADTNVNLNSSAVVRLTNYNSTANNITPIDFYDSSANVVARISSINENHSTHVGSLAFVTRNAGAYGERMRITAGGNVVIGGTNPVARFEVTGSGAGATNTMHLINTNGTSLMVVRDNGTVGIGTATPALKLDFGASGGFLLKGNPGPSTSVSYTGHFHNDFLIGAYIDGSSYLNGVLSFGHVADAARKFHIGSASDANFNASTVFVPTMTFTAGNNVGIGTTIPNTRLEVTGSSSTSGGGTFHAKNSAGTSLFYVRNDGYVGVGTSTSLNATFQVNGSTSITGSVLPGDNGISYDLGSTSYKWRTLYAVNISGSLTPTGATAGSVFFAGASGQIQQDNANFFWDDANNRLGIGNASPGYPLDVTGTSRYTGIAYYDGGESINLYGIRGRFSGEAMHLYNKVAIGYPSGWGGDISTTPIYGLSTYGGAILAYNQGTVGIGTATSSVRLYVHGSSTATTPTMLVKEGVASPTGGVRTFEVQKSTGASIFSVSGSGYVGVGTSNPAGTFEVVGVSGSLLLVTDTLSGSLFSVNDITGLSILEVFSDDTVIAGAANSNALVVTGSRVGIGTSSPSEKLQLIGGNLYLSGTAGGGISAVDYNNSTFSRLIFNNDYSSTAKGPNKITLYDSGWLGGFGIHGGTVGYYSGGSHAWYQATSAANVTLRLTVDGSGNTIPGTDNAQDLGSSSYRWKNLYAVNVSGAYLTGSNLSAGQVVYAGTGGVLNGNNNLYWDNSNARLGVSTNAPDQSIDVRGNIGMSRRAQAAVTRYIGLTNTDGTFSSTAGQGTTGLIIDQHSGGDTSLRFKTGYWGSSEDIRMMIDRAGNIGIGTTVATNASFSYKLDVNGTIRTNSYLTIDAGNSSDYYSFYYKASTTGLSGRVGYFNAGNSTGWFGVETNLDNSTSSGFYVKGLAASNPVFVVNTIGNVGIGTTGADWNTGYRGLMLAKGFSVMARDGSDVYISQNAIYDTSNQWKYPLNVASSQLFMYNGSVVFNRAGVGTTGGVLTWTESMRIDASGNVGIGTNNSNSNRVAISGGNLSVSGSVLPYPDNSVDLGSTSYRWKNLYAMSMASGRVSTTTITALNPGADAYRWEVARIGIDANDWNEVGLVELDLYEDYWDQGSRKRYYVYYGYIAANPATTGNAGVYLAEIAGAIRQGTAKYRVTLGAEVTVSGDQRYVPVYVEASFYHRITTVIRTNRQLTTNSTPPIGFMYINTNPSGVLISDFTPDTNVYINNVSTYKSIFQYSNVGIGVSDPPYTLTINKDNENNGSPTLALTTIANGGSPQIRLQNGTTTWTERINAGTGRYEIYNVSNNATPFTIESTTPSTRMYLNSTGVGINTGSPTTALSVQGSVAALTDFNASVYNNWTWRGLFYENTQQRGVGIAYSSPGGHVIQGLSGAGNGDLSLNNYGGNVAIGTTSPQGRLYVTGSSTSSTSVIVGRAGIPTPSGALLDLQNNEATTAFLVNYQGSVRAGTSGAGMVLDFRTNGANRLDLQFSDGATWYVNPDRSTGSLINFFENTLGAQVYIGNRNADAVNTLRNGSPLYLSTRYWNGSASVAVSPSIQALVDSTSPDYRLNLTAGSGNINIRSNGSVGIGTTSPTYTLDVSGPISMHDEAQDLDSRYYGGTFLRGWSSFNAGTEANITYTTDTSCPVGTEVISVSTYVWPRGPKIRLDKTQNYEVEIWAKRQTANTAGTFYFVVSNYDSSGNVINGDGADWHYPINVNPLPATWTKYRFVVGPYGGSKDHSSTARYISVGFIANYTAGTDVIYLSGFKCRPIPRYNNDALTIYNDGSVGIGLTNPSSKLHVSAGDIRIDSNSYGIVYTSGASTNNVLKHNGTRFIPGQVAYSELSGAPTVNGTTNYVARFTPNGTSLGTGVLFDNGTNVGIGTTTPVAKLHINGSSATSPCLVLPDSTNARYSVGFGNMNVAGVGQRLDFYAGDSGNNSSNLDSTSLRMSLTATGKVGIGTTDPLELLNLGSNSSLFIQGNSNSWGYKINVNDYGGGDVPIRFIRRNSGADTESMRIDQSGRVGIGVTNIPTRLTVLSNNTQGTADTTWVYNANGDYRNSISNEFFGGSAASNKMFLRVSDGTTTAQSTIMTLIGTARVGIGTTDPTSKLQVWTTTDFDGLQIDGINGAATFRSWLRLFPSGSAGAYNPLVGTGDSAIIFSRNSTDTGNLVIAPWTNSSNGIKIDNTGNVGIGTSSMTKKLVVNASDALINGLTVGRGGVASNVGASNTALGSSAGAALTVGYSNNTSIGGSALTTMTVGERNTAVGNSALLNYNPSANTGDSTAVGYASLYNSTSGVQNTAIGSYSLYSATTNSQIVAIGFEAMRNGLSMDRSVAVGYRSMYVAGGDNDNTAVGYQSAYSLDKGNRCTSVGSLSLWNTKDNGDSTAIGYASLYANTGSYNTAVGSYSLVSNTTAAGNTAVGYASLLSISTNTGCTAAGFESLYLTTGPDNTVMGYQAGRGITSGFDNIAIGLQSLYSAAGAAYNVAIGNYALSLTISNSNVAIGHQAGRYLATTTDGNNTLIGAAAGTGASGFSTFSYNTVVGSTAGTSLQTSTYNVLLGFGAGSTITTSGKNVLLGRYDGNSGGLDIRASSAINNNNIVLSDGDGNIRARFDYRGAVGIGTTTAFDGYKMHICSGSINDTLIIAHTPSIEKTAGYHAYAGNKLAVFEINAGTSQARIGSYTSQSLSIVTNNTRAISVDTSQRVGIGTDTMVQKLHIGAAAQTMTATPDSISLGGTYSDQAGVTSKLKLRLYDDGAGVVNGFGVSNLQMDYSAMVNVSHVWYINNTEVTRINASGNVGIGTSTIGTRLHVHSGATDEVARFEGTGNPYISIYDSGTRNAYLYSNTSSVELVSENSKPLYLQGATEIRLRSNGANDRVVIDTSGNVGINTNSMSSRLDVVGNGTGSPLLRLRSTVGSGHGYVQVGDSSTANNNWHFGSENNGEFVWWTGTYGAGTFRAKFTSAGKAFKGDGGTLWDTGSDERLKKNVTSINGPLEKILKLRGVEFEWKKPEAHNGASGRVCGFIAQELEKVYPLWVGESNTHPEERDLVGEDKYKTMTLGNDFFALTVESFRALKSENDSLKSEIQSLKDQISSILAVLNNK